MRNWICSRSEIITEKLSRETRIYPLSLCKCEVLLAISECLWIFKPSDHCSFLNTTLWPICRRSVFLMSIFAIIKPVLNKDISYITVQCCFLVRLSPIIGRISATSALYRWSNPWRALLYHVVVSGLHVFLCPPYLWHGFCCFCWASF